MLVLHLGAGKRPRPKWVNIDLNATTHFGKDCTIAVKHDLREGLPFDDDYFDLVYSSHFFEHLDSAFGQLLSSTGTTPNSYLFAGQEFEAQYPRLAALQRLYQVRWRGKRTGLTAHQDVPGQQRSSRRRASRFNVDEHQAEAVLTRARQSHRLQGHPEPTPLRLTL